MSTKERNEAGRGTGSVGMRSNGAKSVKTSPGEGHVSKDMVQRKGGRETEGNGGDRAHLAEGTASTKA